MLMEEMCLFLCLFFFQSGPVQGATGVQFVRWLVLEFAGLYGPDLSAHDSSSSRAVSVAPVAQLSLSK